MTWSRETSDLLRDTQTVREQLVQLTAQLDGFVERLKAATDDTSREEEVRGQVEG